MSRTLRRRYGRARARVYPAYHCRGVLAGAYRGKRVSERALATHAVGVDAEGREAPKSLCSKIDSERLSDRGGGEPAGSTPSCSTCAERLERIGAKITA